MTLTVRPGAMLPVDKPRGLTSHDVVARARKALDTRQIGHTGTLDPFAEGLLLLLVGAATRLSQYLGDLDKTYRATAVLGETTDTLDPEGEVVERDETWRTLDEAAVGSVLGDFVGPFEQVPPQFSAKKVAGEAMYRKARRGESVVLEPVSIRIHDLELVRLDLPRVEFTVRSSRGTYIRSLARDLGAALGTCAHLGSLRRTRIGSFRVADAVTLEALERSDDAVEKAMVSPGRAVAHLPSVQVDAGAARLLGHGRFLEDVANGAPPGEPLAVLVGDRLVAVGERIGDRLQPRKVFLDV